MKKPAWFEREQPRDWNRSRIQVDGDDRQFVIDAMKDVAKILGAIAIFWGLISLLFVL